MNIEALVTALVAFHKAQCYFSSTIQITVLLLFHQTQRSEAIPKVRILVSGLQQIFLTGHFQLFWRPVDLSP